MVRTPYTWPALALLAALGAPTTAPAAALQPGDLVILQPYYWNTARSVTRVDPATGLPIETITSSGLLSDPDGLCIMPGGKIIVADRVAGLIEINPVSGDQSILEAPSAFAGAGPRDVARENDGNLVVVCADHHVWRVPAGGGPPVAFEAAGPLTEALGIAVAPDGTLWVADGLGRIVAVNPGTGVQTQLVTSGVTYATPYEIAVSGTSGPLYVVMYGVFGYHLGGGLWTIDRATGAGQKLANLEPWIEGLAVNASGEAIVTAVGTINHDTPYYAYIDRVDGTSVSALGPQQRLTGLLGIVPSQASASVNMTWGRLKAMMR